MVLGAAESGCANRHIRSADLDTGLASSTTAQYGFELSLQFGRQLEWIERLVTLPQLRRFRAFELSTGDQALVSRLRHIVAAHPTTAHAPFLNQLHRGEKKVVQRSPDLFVEAIDRLHHLRPFQAPVA